MDKGQLPSRRTTGLPFRRTHDYTCQSLPPEVFQTLKLALENLFENAVAVLLNHLESQLPMCMMKTDPSFKSGWGPNAGTLAISSESPGPPCPELPHPQPRHLCSLTPRHQQAAREKAALTRLPLPALFPSRVDGVMTTSSESKPCGSGILHPGDLLCFEDKF